MARFTTIEASLSTYGGDGVDVTKLKQTNFSITAPSGILDTTGLANPVRTVIPDMGQWSARLSGVFPAAGPQSGKTATIVFASGNDANPRAFTLNANIAFEQVDELGQDWSFMDPHTGSWGGTYTVTMDDTEVPDMPTVPAGSSAAATFTYATGITAAGNIVITDSNFDVAKNVGVPTCTYTFEGDGDLTFAGANGIIAAGTLAVPSAGSSTFTLQTNTTPDQTFGGDMFWSSLSISCAARQETRVDVGFTGTGALSPTWS